MANMKAGQLGRITGECPELKLVDRIVGVTKPNISASLETGCMVWDLDKPLNFLCSHCVAVHTITNFPDFLLRPIDGNPDGADETLAWKPVPHTVPVSPQVPLLV